MRLTLDTPVTALKGVGKARTEVLQKSQIYLLRDLLFLFPRDYRSGKQYLLCEERVGLFSYFLLTVTSQPTALTLKGKRRCLRFIAEDTSGTKVQILYFNQPYLKNQISKGETLCFGGVLQEKSGVFYLFSPQRKKIPPDENTFYPVYPTVGGISSKQMEGLIGQFLPFVLSEIKETLSSAIVDQFGLMARAKAIFLVHRPTCEESLAKAKYRFAFEELFRYSVRATLFARRQFTEKTEAFFHRDCSPFLSSLPFPLTTAQSRVLTEICEDMTGDGMIPPMNRLLQGDVGSGKTVVAAAAAYLCAANGKSTLVMAPTEILACQHYASFTAFMKPHNIPVFLLTGSTKKKEREAIYAETQKESPYILIGTHALTEEGTRCRNVALAITDEQHRFGVKQRSLLGEKGGAVHSLVMSATPIPRSLAMFLHAKSRISVIDTLPPGRQPVDTLYVGEEKLTRVYGFLAERIAQGEQAFIVCPLIEDETGDNPLMSAQEEYQEIQKALPEIPSLLLHGKMKAEEKNAVMAAFQKGEAKILVSTTVIEVGVDVPNASVMVIRSAERFGLSQLHQLRGRVGRGSTKSYCILVSSHPGKGARERLKKLCDCYDGFELAQFDLKTRGPGEFFGTRQSGFSSFELKDAFSMEMIQDAGQAAALFLDSANPEELVPYEQEIALN